MDADAVERLVREFWRRMASNDFDSVGALLSDDFIVDWPMSRERIRGRAGYARMNTDYPSHGAWRFDVHRLVAGTGQAATDVSITDGVQDFRALSFFTVRDGRIARLVEYWPDPAPAGADRAHLVEPIA